MENERGIMKQFTVRDALIAGKQREIEEALDMLDPDDRLKVFEKYCTSCGDKDPSCQCWNDE